MTKRTIDWGGRVSEAYAHDPEDVIVKLYWDKSQYYENKLNQLLRYFRKLGDVDCYVDVGAHLGNHAMWMKFQSKDMYLFEPNKEVFECLKKNCPEAKCYNIALGSRDGEVKTKSTKKRNSGQTEVVEGSGIAMRTLDYYKLKPNVIKIDVEGMEYDVLMGASETINRNRPVVAVEVSKNEDKINEFFKIRGYTCRTTANVTKTNIYYP